jgi:anti-sigma factor RsiW
MNDAVATDADLDAYIDNQLDPHGRMRVESFLAAHPAAAARVMSDLAIRHALRIGADEGEAAIEQRLRDAAGRLEKGLSQRQTFSILRRVAAVGVFITAGWFAHGQLGAFGFTAVNASSKPPAFVDDAVRAHQTTQVRETMASQVHAVKYDPDDIRSSTAIAMPAIPSAWRVVDVQVYPSEFGPSVELSLAEKDGARMSLFAVRPGFFAVEPLRTRHLPDSEAAYWQIGEVAYALVSSVPNRDLSDEAELLAKTLY